MKSHGGNVLGPLVLAIALLIPATGLMAADAPPPPNVVQHWTLWPKAGHEADFEKAIKAFVAWRKSAGEGFGWQAYTPVVGDDLTFYVFRAGPFHWKDLDAQAEWAQKSGVSAEYLKNVAMHVERAEHYLVALDTEHSLWYDSDDYRYFGVSQLKIKPGANESMMEALKAIHKVAKESDWKPGYMLEWVIGGAAADLVFVNPYRSWAEMADPETPFMKTMADALGSDRVARGLMKQLWGSFEPGRYTIVVHRPDLSTQE